MICISFLKLSLHFCLGLSVSFVFLFSVELCVCFFFGGGEVSWRMGDWGKCSTKMLWWKMQEKWREAEHENCPIHTYMYMSVSAFKASMKWSGSFYKFLESGNCYNLLHPSSTNYKTWQAWTWSSADAEISRHVSYWMQYSHFPLTHRSSSVELGITWYHDPGRLFIQFCYV